MKNQNTTGAELPPIPFRSPDLEGLEVTELHGSFADSQWLDAVSRHYDDIVRPWVDTQMQDEPRSKTCR